MNKTPFCKALGLAASALLMASAAQAQSAGDLVLRAGATRIAPDVTSGDLTAPSLAGTQASVAAANQVSAGVTWFYTPQISFDLPLALPFTHEVKGAGAIASAGKIGTLKALPVTVLAQYRLLDAKAPVRPYLGLGLTYAKFFDTKTTAVLTGLTGGTPEHPTTMSVENKFAPTFQLGATVPLNDKFSLDLGVVKTLLKTTTTLSTGQTLALKLDPMAVQVAVAWKY